MEHEMSEEGRNGWLTSGANSSPRTGPWRRFTGTLNRPRILLKRILPHTAIMIAVLVYTISGGYVFYVIEKSHNPSIHEKVQASAAAEPSPRSARHVITTQVAVKSTEMTTSTSLTSEPIVSVLHRRRHANGDSTQRRSASAQRIRPRRRANQSAVTSGQQGEDWEDRCSRKVLSSVVHLARTNCMMAIATDRNREYEFPAHYCAKLISQLHECIYKPEMELDDDQKAKPTKAIQKLKHNMADDLTLSGCIFMAFTIISTIGYGHVAPVTMWGRIFCILYGLFGIPLALLAIADQGRFLSAAVMSVYKKTKSVIKHGRIGRRRNADAFLDENDPEEESMPALVLLAVFAMYMLLGGVLLGSYEQWSYVDAVYFSFVSSSSIGFGDVVPREGPYLPVTLLYIALGLALSTAAIDVFAGYLRKLHHWGRKIRNCANKLIWFGGKRVTLKQLVRNMGVQLGVPEEKINHLVENFDEVVETTIQQAETAAKTGPPEGPLISEKKEMEEKQDVKPKLMADCIDFIDDRDMAPAENA